MSFGKIAVLIHAMRGTLDDTRYVYAQETQAGIQQQITVAGTIC